MGCAFSNGASGSSRPTTNTGSSSGRGGAPRRLLGRGDAAAAAAAAAVEAELGAEQWMGEWGTCGGRVGPVRVLAREDGAGIGASAVAVGADGGVVVVGYEDGGVEVFEVGSGRSRRVRALRGHTALGPGVGGAAAGAGAGVKPKPVAVTVSWDATARVWDWRSGAEVRRLGVGGAALTCVGLSAGGTRAVTGSDDQFPRVWNVDTGDVELELRAPGDGGSPNGMLAAISASGSVAATARRDAPRLGIWDVDGRVCLRTIPIGDLILGHTFGPFVSLSSDGSLVAVTALQAQVWDTATGERLAVLGRGRPTSVAFDADAQHVIENCSEDVVRPLPDRVSSVRVWDWRAQRHCLALRLPDDKSGVRRDMDVVAVSPRERVVVVGCSTRGGGGKRHSKALVAWTDSAVEDATLALLGRRLPERRDEFDVGKFILRVDGDHAMWTRVVGFLRGGGWGSLASYSYSRQDASNHP